MIIETIGFFTVSLTFILDFLRVLLVFQGEMVTLVFQDNQAPLALLAHLESVNLVLLVLR